MEDVGDRADREALNVAYAELFERLTEILFRHDPIGINFETNTDEYEPEVSTIIPRLRSATSREDVRRVVHEEFMRWFDGGMAGGEANYDAIATEVWDLRELFPKPYPMA